MASAPFLEAFVSSVFGPVYSAVGADPAMAATTFIAVDMGGNPLAEALAQGVRGELPPEDAPLPLLQAYLESRLEKRIPPLLTPL